MQLLEAVLGQQVCVMISQVNEVLKTNAAENLKDTENQHAAIREVAAAQAHASHYYLSSYREAVDRFTGCSEAKRLLTSLGVLFGINQVLSKSLVLAQSGLTDPNVFTSLQICKERLLKELRQSFITVVDGVGIPDGAIRSHITNDNLYEVRLTPT